MLHYFITKEIPSEKVAEQYLNFFENGKENYLLFRKDRFIENTNKLSDIINQVKLPFFIATKTKKVTSGKAQSADLLEEVSNGQRITDIVRSRGFWIKELLKYDHLSCNPLFDGDDTTKHDKHTLTKELEKKYLVTTHFQTFPIIKLR